MYMALLLARGCSSEGDTIPALKELTHSLRGRKRRKCSCSYLVGKVLQYKEISRKQTLPKCSSYRYGFRNLTDLDMNSCSQ